MIKLISENGEWNIIIDGLEYNFYYMETKPIKGLCLNGLDTQQEEYQICNYLITATKEKYIYTEQGYRYILKIRDKDSQECQILKLQIREEGKVEVLKEGSLNEIVKYLQKNYDKLFEWIEDSVREENGISETRIYEDLSLEEQEVLKEKLPVLDNIDTQRELKYELEKVNLSWWMLEIEEV